MCPIISTFLYFISANEKTAHRVVPHQNGSVLARERNLAIYSPVPSSVPKMRFCPSAVNGSAQIHQSCKKRFLFCIKNRPGFLLRKPRRFILFIGALSGAQHLTNWHSVFEVLVISVFRGLSVHFSERFFQTDHCFFDDFCFIGRAICKLFGHPAVEHRLCFFDFDAQQLVR